MALANERGKALRFGRIGGCIAAIPTSMLAVKLAISKHRAAFASLVNLETPD